MLSDVHEDPLYITVPLYGFVAPSYQEDTVTPSSIASLFFVVLSLAICPYDELLVP